MAFMISHGFERRPWVSSVRRSVDFSTSSFFKLIFFPDSTHRARYSPPFLPNLPTNNLVPDVMTNVWLMLDSLSRCTAPGCKRPLTYTMSVSTELGFTLQPGCLSLVVPARNSRASRYSGGCAYSSK